MIIPRFNFEGRPQSLTPLIISILAKFNQISYVPQSPPLPLRERVGERGIGASRRNHQK